MQLNKVHNLIKNCKDNRELREHILLLSVDDIYNNINDEFWNNMIMNAVVACEYSSIPMYYFKASTTSGLKQDRNGNWYK